MVSADEDITTELDKVVCRLMKLALRTTKSRTCVPPSKWMQFKLLDLLTLTEKTIAKRKQHCIQGLSLKAIGFDELKCIENTTLGKFKNDSTAADILDKYKNIMSFSDIDVSTTPFLDNKQEEKDIVNNDICVLPFEQKVIINDETKLERTQAWVEEENEVHIVNYPFHKENPESRMAKHSFVENEIRRSSKKKRKIGDKKTSNTKLKKVLPAKSSSNSLLKRYKTCLASRERRRYDFKSQKRIKYHQILQSRASKPIPGSIIELCHPELRIQKNIDYSFKDTVWNNMQIDKVYTNIAATEESLLVDIVMDDTEETKALRRTIGTYADTSYVNREQGAILNSVKSADKEGRSDIIQLGTKNVQSPTIFIYDINEPSTSKGVRHISMDVQCGTDPIFPSCAMPSPVASLTKLPSVFTTGIKIEDSKTNFMRLDSPPKSLTRAKSPSIFNKGIKIGDSTTDIKMKNYSSHFGTLLSEEEIPGVLYESGRGLKIQDSITNTRIRRSLDFDGLKNSEKCLPIKPEKIQFSDDVFDIKRTSINKLDFGACTDSKTGCRNKTKSKVSKILKPKFLKFYPEEIDNVSATDLKTNEVNFDFSTSPDDNYINNINEITQYETPKKYCSFSTSTDDFDENFKSVPRMSIGVIIKDSETKAQRKVNSCTETLAELIPSGTPLKCSFAMETKLIKQKTNTIKMEDTCSEFNESCVTVKCPSLCLNYLGMREDNVSPTRELKLSRGGIHVHSYREKQVSEDIMYQGEWQRHKPKTNARKAENKKVTDSVLRKRRTSSKEKIQNRKVETKKAREPVLRKRRVSSKERVLTKISQKKIEGKAEQKKPVQVRRPKVDKPKENNLTKTELEMRNFLKRDAIQKSVWSKRGVVKVASKIPVSSVSSKTKNTFLVKRASALICTVVSKHDNKMEKRSKNYIPRYLIRRRIREAQKLNLTDKIKINKSQENLELGEIQKQLTKFNPESLNSMSYVVFRNEVEGMNNTGTDNQTTDSVKDSISRNKEKHCITKHSTSPGSPNSSTCSIADSIATIKAVSTRSKVSMKKHSTPLSKSAINSESDSNTPVKNKQNIKKDDKNHENKENVPETSEKNNKCSLNYIKSAFMGRNRSVFMARLETDSTTKHKDQGYRKSNIKIPVIEDNNDKKRCDSLTIMKYTSDSLASEENKTVELISDVSNFSQITDILDHSFEQRSIPHLQYSEESTVVQVISNNTVKTEWFESARSSAHSTKSTIETAMRRIVEDSLEFAFRSPKFTDDINSESLTLCCEHCLLNVEATLSPISYKTTIRENFNTALLSELENALNRSFDFESAVDGVSIESYTPSLMTDNTEVFSFNSTSEFFLGDGTMGDNDTHSPYTRAYSVEEKVDSFVNKADSNVDIVDYVVDRVDSVINKMESIVDTVEPSEIAVEAITANVESIFDIYEVKQTLITENPGGGLAIQPFSGFSMNTDRVAGDQPDYVNLIDSETGSLAVDFTRQATSEELFVSGRSSESFQSCLMDEDAVVPNWLFNIIQQQQSVNIPVLEDDGELLLPMAVALPMSEPIFDLNGNVTEPSMGVGAGAGDGCGIHSDNSRDSSGRGTSLSSSETSSGALSEGILMDPSSAYTAQSELLQDSVASSTAVTTLVVPSSNESLNPLRRTEGAPIDAGTTSIARNNAAPSRRDGRRYHTSDVDADVSSMDDTDVPDYSDS